MRRSHSLRVAVAALLVSQGAWSQESKTEEVVVTSSALRGKKPARKSRKPTTVVAGDDLRRQIASSLGETLSSELGVSSTYFGPNASRPVIRGLSGDRVQVLQDGLASLDVSSLSQDHAVTLESVVSQQIEIIKGPAALLYGSGASGGLVNVVSSRVPTEVPAKIITGAAEVRGETATEERTGAASIDGGTGKFAFHADYFNRKTEDVKIPGYAQSDALRRELIEAGEEPDNVRGYIPNSEGEASGGALGGSFIGQNALGGLSYSRYETTYGIPGEAEAFIAMKQNRLDGKAELDLQGVVNKLRLTGAYNDYTHTEFEAPGEPGTVFNQDAYELRFTADHKLGSGWRGTTGLQYVDLDFEAIGEEAFVPSSKTRALSVFAFEERHFGIWTVELGARAEQQKIDVAADLPGFNKTAVSLSAGTVWDFAKDHALALNLTRTQRNSQPAELYADGPHIAAQRFEIGDPNLKQETSVTADLSLRHTGDGINWTLSAFYNDYSNYIYASPTGDIEDDLPVFVYLQNGAKFHGFEAELNVPLIDDGKRHLGLRLASDYVRAKLDNGESLPQIPPLRFGAGLHYDRDEWHVGAQAFYYAKQDKIAEHELPTDSFILAEVDASYRFPVGSTSVFLFVRGTNLLDEDARQHASPLKDIAPLPGRSLHIGARAEF
ncbi:TonB-dependent receptor [Steroidobacter cummioxidans]|uniref:TonB-dependent receptor n=1 Tax=Steroidobacter cummioxidans TaxID=1803913 RepID=UPI000E31C931|nr:TonB-dependent receptor [Steroidobacter cummioxidans]